MTDRATSRGCRSTVALFGIALLVACARTQPLLDPFPIAAGESESQTRVAILLAMTRSGWVFQSEQPGEIVVQFDQQDWNAVVAISYDEKIVIRYVSSENIDFDASKAVIHPGYNKRVQELQDAIQDEIAILRATSDPTALAVPLPTVLKRASIERFCTDWRQLRRGLTVPEIEALGIQVGVHVNCGARRDSIQHGHMTLVFGANESNECGLVEWSTPVPCDATRP